MKYVVYHLVPTSNHNTSCYNSIFISGCLSSCSYIKPQHVDRSAWDSIVVYHLVPTSNHNCPNPIITPTVVVYHLVPTSNHNCQPQHFAALSVVYHLVPTSNHNLRTLLIFRCTLFIILFLHQTTTSRSRL